MRVLLASFPAALLLLSACGGGTRAPSVVADTECLQGAPFAQTANAIYAKYEPRLSALSDRLAAARTVADDQAALAAVAEVLAEQEADLRALHAPAADADAVRALLGADEGMRSAAERLSRADASTLAQAQPAFAAAAQLRGQAARALELRAEFVEGECAS